MHGPELRRQPKRRGQADLRANAQLTHTCETFGEINRPKRLLLAHLKYELELAS